MPEEPVNLMRIARAAGVSAMTVSRALRNHPNVSMATKKKVLAAAENLQYRPNPLVSALMSARRAGHKAATTAPIAFVTKFPAQRGWKKHPIYEEFYEGAAGTADRHGYKIEEFWLNEPGMTDQRMSDVLYHRNITGLLLAPLPVAQGDLHLNWERFSAVTLGYSLAQPALHRAVNHQFRSMRTAIREVRALGYRRLGLALPASLNERVIQHWLGGFLVEQHSWPREERAQPLLVEDEDWTEAGFKKWIETQRPDAIISHSSVPFEWLKRLGLKVPEDIGYAHLNCASKNGPLSGIYQNGPAVGGVALEFLIGMMQRNERGIPPLAHSILVESTWVGGETVRCR